LRISLTPKSFLTDCRVKIVIVMERGDEGLDFLV
jgi:hypothetical protein